MKTMNITKLNAGRDGFIIKLSLSDDTHIEKFEDVITNGFGLFLIEQDNTGHHKLTWGSQFKPWGNLVINQEPKDLTLVSFHMLDDGCVQIYRNWIGDD
jgi:hypothetical protein